MPTPHVMQEYMDVPTGGERRVIVALRHPGVVRLKTSGLCAITAFEGILDGSGSSSLGFRVIQFWDRKGQAKPMRFSVTIPHDNIASVVEVPEEK
jgi:hypothetical protein